MPKVKDKEEKIIETIQKLLALSESDNEYKASLALEKAHGLLKKYNIDIARVGTPSENLTTSESVVTGSNREWRKNLVMAVGRANYCKPYTSGKLIKLIGTAENIAVSREMVAWLEPIIERFALKGAWGKPRGVSTLSFKNSFCLGMVKRIDERLKAMMKRDDSDDDSRAIVVHHDAANEQYAKTNLHLRSIVRHVSNSSADGYTSGYVKGNDVGLTPPSKQVRE